jgi:hypothetical protein
LSLPVANLFSKADLLVRGGIKGGAGNLSVRKKTTLYYRTASSEAFARYGWWAFTALTLVIQRHYSPQ